MKIDTFNILLGFSVLLTTYGCTVKPAVNTESLPVLGEIESKSLITDQSKSIAVLLPEAKFSKASTANPLVSSHPAACASGEHEVQLVRLNKKVNAATIKQELDNAGMVPANFAVLLQYATQYPDDQLSRDIVSLQEIANKNQTTGYPFLASYKDVLPGEREEKKLRSLHTKETYSSFSNKATILAVRKDSPLSCL